MLEAYSSARNGVSEEETESGSLLHKYIPRTGHSGERSSPKKRPLTVKNGAHMVVLLAGGPRDLARQIREKLARSRGMYVKYHLESDKETTWDRPLPPDVDLVIFLKDFASHSHEHKVVQRCKKANVRWIRTQRKLAIMVGALHAHGIRAAESLPEDLISVMQFNDDAPTLREAQTEPEALTSAPAPVAALAEISVVDPGPALNLIAEQAAAPLAPPSPRRGLPSPRLAAIAAALNLICAEEGVTVLLDGKQMQITAA